MKVDSSDEPRRKRSGEMGDKEARDFAKASKKKKPSPPQGGKKTGDAEVTNNKTPRTPPKNASQNKTHSPRKSKSHSKFANISHKHSTGATNWQKFLQENQEGVKRPTVKNTSAEYKSSLAQPNSNSSSNSNSAKMTKVVGMDCEMVGVGEDGRDSVLARVSIVNAFGDCIYDKYVKPRETVTDYRTYVSGIREEDVVDGEDFETVQREVADILRRRILVGHAVKNDLEVLFLSHPRQNTRDTAKFFRKGGCKTPSLKTLAAEYLDVVIQEGEHSSVQDAKAAVMLYNLYKKQWEIGGGNRKHNRIDTYHHKIRPGQQNLVDDT